MVSKNRPQARVGIGDALSIALIADNRRLTPEFIETGGESLHSISWTDKIGDLPAEWNHLVSV